MSIRLVVGLGNPGDRYVETRHNIGFRVVDEFVRRCGGLWRSDGLSVIADVGALTVAKPQTFMNRSGAAVADLIIARELPPEGVLVIVDDIDLPLGRLRLRPRGGPGTHNGLRDICAALGNDYARLRAGVRDAEEIDADLADYVLAPFAEADSERVDALIVRAADAVEAATRDGVAAAMNVFNRAPVPVNDGPDGGNPQDG